MLTLVYRSSLTHLLNAKINVINYLHEHSFII
jgi:hypothetical protein